MIRTILHSLKKFKFATLCQAKMHKINWGQGGIVKMQMLLIFCKGCKNEKNKIICIEIEYLTYWASITATGHREGRR